MKISQAVVLLAPHLRVWVEEHLISPCPVRFAIDVKGTSFKNLWLVTNHNGTRDSSYRVVYDDETDEFGLECTLDSGVEWYMGNYGALDEVVENM